MAFCMFPLNVVVEVDELNGTGDSVTVDLARSLICDYCFMIRSHCEGSICEDRSLKV